MNKHILDLYEKIMDELEKQGLRDTQVDIEFLPRKSFMMNKTIRIRAHNWSGNRHATYTVRQEELKLKENLAMDILSYLLKEVSNAEN